MPQTDARDGHSHSQGTGMGQGWGASVPGESLTCTIRPPSVQSPDAWWGRSAPLPLSLVLGRKKEDAAHGASALRQEQDLVPECQGERVGGGVQEGLPHRSDLGQEIPGPVGSGPGPPGVRTQSCHHRGGCGGKQGTGWAVRRVVIRVPDPKGPDAQRHHLDMPDPWHLC